MSKNVLITGGLGFIGSHLARSLVQSGDKVTIFSRTDRKRKNIADIEDSINLIVKDIRLINQSDVQGIDQIFHLAGTVDNYAVENNTPFRDVEINCLGTQALLEACRLAKSKARLVFGSTFFVYGNLDRLPATPKSPTLPLSLYAATRLCAENLTQIYGKAYDLNPVIARFTNVFGPNDDANKQKGAFNWMIDLAVRGETLKVYNNGEFVRDYIYVTDAADACRVVAEKGERGKVYNIGRGPVKFADLVDIIKQQLPETKTEFMEPPIHHKNVGTKDFYASSKETKDLGWAPKISLKEGIYRTIRHYKELSNRQ